MTEPSTASAELPSTGQTGASSGAAPAPCECMTSWAYISPIHPGHCCFLSPQATCHEDEFAVWKAESDRRKAVTRAGVPDFGPSMAGGDW